MTTCLLATFWYYNGKFYGEEDILDGNKTCVYGDYMQVDRDHFATWDKYRKQMGLPSSIPYDKVPRGRILFKIKTHSFEVVASKAIVLNKDVQQELLTYYNLPANTVFIGDLHYQ